MPDAPAHAIDRDLPPLQPIGVFDSGVGGLSVLRAIRARLPGQPLIYIADSAHAPYGDRDAAYITARARHLTAWLRGEGAGAVVVACNTATVVAVDTLRQSFDLPIVALEPAIKPAVAATRTGVVAVLATTRTLQSAAVERLVRVHGGTARILLQACPGLVEQVERGDLDGESTRALLDGYLRPVLDAGADTLVLGCTHYPFLAPLIRQLAGAGVAILDSADAVALQVQRRLSAGAAASSHGDAGVPPAAPMRFLTTGDPVAAQALFSRLWGAPVQVMALEERSHDGSGPGPGLRRAVWADASAIFETHRAAVMAACTPHYSADHMTAWFAGRTHEIYRPAIDAGQIWLDALDAPDGRVRGFVGAIPGEITLLFVDPACAGQGLGQRLFEAGWRIAAQGCEQVQVMSTLNAVSYYAARGFEPVTTVHFERGTPPLRFPVLHMRRTVLPHPPESTAT